MYRGRQQQSFKFSGLFIRDGEVIAHTAVLDPMDMAGEIRGWLDQNGKPWFMQFRSFDATGKCTVSAFAACLCTFSDLKLATGELESPQARKVPQQVGVLQLVIRRYVDEAVDDDEVAPLDVKILPKYEEQEMGVKQELEHAQDRYHDDFQEWYDAKPRQTHTAE